MPTPREEVEKNKTGCQSEAEKHVLCINGYLHVINSEAGMNLFAVGYVDMSIFACCCFCRSVL